MKYFPSSMYYNPLNIGSEIVKLFFSTLLSNFFCHRLCVLGMNECMYLTLFSLKGIQRKSVTHLTKWFYLASNF